MSVILILIISIITLLSFISLTFVDIFLNRKKRGGMKSYTEIVVYLGGGNFLENMD